jgi:hypothetical protein
VLCWILFYCVSSYLGSSSSDYIDVSPIIPSFCRNPLDILVVLVPFFLDLSQECWTIFCIMVCCVTVHTCRWWKWTFPCIMSWLLEVVAHYWTSASSKSSSTSSSTSVSTSISSQVHCTEVPDYTAQGYIVAAHCCIVVAHCYIVVCIIVWWWYLVELRCNLSCHHFFLHPISI